MLGLSALGFFLIAVNVLLLLNYYCSFRRMPSYLVFALFIAVFIPFSIILLVPVDLASTFSDSKPLLSLPRKYTYFTWRILYWLSFGLTWLVLPMLQAYLESGQNENSKKIREALKANAKQQLINFTVGIIGLIYFIFYAGFAVSSVRGLVIALSHSYALIFSMWFLGIGVVRIPRKLFRNSTPRLILNDLEKRAPRVHDSFIESRSQLNEVSSEAKSLAPVKVGPYQNWIEKLIKMAEPGSSNTSHFISRSQVTEDYLSHLTSRLRKAKILQSRYELEWRVLVNDAANIADVIEAVETRSLKFRNSSSLFSPKIAFIVYYYIVPFIYRALGLLLSVLSITVVWSITTQGTMFSLLGLVTARTSGFTQEMMSFGIIAYMCISTYASLAGVKIFNIYALAQKHTDSSSAIFYANQICKMTIPLSYTYVMMSPRLSTPSVFEEFLQPSINLTPLGKYFTMWLPRFLLIPVLFSLFNFYEKIQNLIGFGLEFGDDDENDGNRAEGQDLISYELSSSSGLLLESADTASRRFILSPSSYNPLPTSFD
ncbi:LMBR1-like membrane protein-domain-containing protein [Lipomyces japonicus]|uniref:LMBR1-like membrane protein-domain-containing protein n=1 Tax=Lipomyces japonicus TaxID=56871 RepID=UPI0034CFC640